MAKGKKLFKNKVTKKQKSKNRENEQKTITFIAGIIILVLLSFGCTQMSRTEKNLCYSLATKSYAYVPVCETEQSCFTKVSELFKTSLAAEEENQLYSIKNHVARSWFFYNKAVTESKTVAALCQKGDASELSGAINQTQLYINGAFNELD